MLGASTSGSDACPPPMQIFLMFMVVLHHTLNYGDQDYYSDSGVRGERGCWGNVVRKYAGLERDCAGLTEAGAMDQDKEVCAERLA